MSGRYAHAATLAGAVCPLCGGGGVRPASNTHCSCVAGRRLREICVALLAAPPPPVPPPPLPPLTPGIC